MLRLTVQILASLLLPAVLAAAAAEPAQQASGALEITLKAGAAQSAAAGEKLRLYSASKALVIGIDNYSAGWSKLSGAVKDAKAVAEALKRQGFQVTFAVGLTLEELERAFKDFFIVGGADPDARLLVWFAGHGHTIKNSSGGDEGYIVPRDAPDPRVSETDFLLKAISLRRFGEYMRHARAKHVLAVFDSCFGGSVFNVARALPPAAITRATALPVRQFISSGDADQVVSDDGTFRRLFIDALQGAEPSADINKDGYLTGTGLGQFLQYRMTNLPDKQQTPRYGKLNAQGYDQGDFVFRIGELEVSATPKPSQAAPQAPDEAKTLASQAPAPLDPALEAEGKAIAAARAEKSISAFEDYLAKVNQRTFKGTFRDEARRSIADLERWERMDKNSPEALKAYLGGTDKPLMAEEARKAIAALFEAAEHEACEAYATTAAEQIERARKLGCSVAGDKWSARKVVQISECVELTTVEARTAQTGERNRELTQCQNDKDEAEAWGKLQATLGQKPVKAATKAKAETATPELVALSDKIAGLSTDIATINAFLASNPNGANGKFANEARAAIDGRARQIEGLKAKTLDMDRALWAKAEATPNCADGYKTYLAILPDGEHSKAEVEAILADLETCEAARKADDVTAMKAYREKFVKGRCAEEFAKLMAPPTDLTGAKLVILPRAPGAKQTVENTVPIKAFAFSAESTSVFLATSNDRHTLQKWELATGRVGDSPSHGGNSVAYDSLSPDGNWLGSAQVFPPFFYRLDHSATKSLGSGKPNQLDDPRYSPHYKGPLSQITPQTASWSKNAVYHSFFVGAAEPKVAQHIYVWDVAAQRLIGAVPVPEKEADVRKLAVSGDGHWVAALVLWKEEYTKQTLARKPVADECDLFPDFMAKNPPKEGIVCQVKKSNIRIYDIRNRTLLRVVNSGPGWTLDIISLGENIEKPQWATAFDFSMDSSRIFIGYTNGNISTENIQTGKLEYNEPMFATSGSTIYQIYELPDQAWLLAQSGISYAIFHEPKKYFESVNSLVPLRQPARRRLEPGESLCLSDKRQSIWRGSDCTSYLINRSMFFPNDSKLQSCDGGIVSIGSTKIKAGNDSCASYIQLWSMLGQANSELRAISPDSRFFVTDGAEAYQLWDLHSGQISATLRLLPDGGYVTSTPSGAFTASDDAEPYLAVEIGKRRWPLADVPTFKKKFFQKDGVNLLAP